MLSVGGPLAITTTVATTSTTTTTLPLPINFTTTPGPSSSRLLEGVVGNLTLEIPQGDQPPVPPIKEGPPRRPGHWEESTKRLFFVKNRYGKYLEMWPDGRTQGVSENNTFCLFWLMSHIVHVVMRGYVSDLYLCMNTTTYQLYARKEVHPDCYIQENLRNGTGNLVYSFAHCRTPKGKKCYLGMHRNGTMRRGQEARQSQMTAQWLPLSANETDAAQRDRKDWLQGKGGWSPPPLPVPTTPRPISKREQRRKRARNWCRNLDVIVKRPKKHLARCRHDCDILQRMIADPERSMRRCLQYHVRRHLRKKKKGAVDSPEAAKRDNAKIRARMRVLWPKRKEIFQRLRQLHRCNKKLRRQKDGQKLSCSKREVRRQLQLRVKKRRQAKAGHHHQPSSPSASPSSPSHTRPRSRARPGSRRRVRHQRKRTGKGERGAKRRRVDSARRDSDKRDGEKTDRSSSIRADGGGAVADDVQVRRQKRRAERSALWTALTAR